MTVLAIIAVALLLILIVAGAVYMTSEAVSGRCAFAWLWLVCGGLEKSAELIGKLLMALVELVGELTSGN